MLIASVKRKNFCFLDSFNSRNTFVTNLLHLWVADKIIAKPAAERNTERVKADLLTLHKKTIFRIRLKSTDYG